MAQKGYVYVSEDEEKEPDSKRARSGGGGGLRRLDSVFLRSEAPVAPVVRAPDWQRAWTNFLAATRDQKTFYHNPALKGMWSGLLFFVEQFESQVKRVVKVRVVREHDRVCCSQVIRRFWSLKWTGLMKRRAFGKYRRAASRGDRSTSTTTSFTSLLSTTLACTAATTRCESFSFLFRSDSRFSWRRKRRGASWRTSE
jgi:hypothetical protein